MKSFFLICSIIIPYLLSAQDSLHNNKSNIEYSELIMVRIYSNDPSEIYELIKQGMTFESVKFKDGHFDLFIDEYEMNILKRSGCNYEIIPNVNKYFLENVKE